jgi:hypothetical protein
VGNPNLELPKEDEEDKEDEAGHEEQIDRTTRPTKSAWKTRQKKKQSDLGRRRSLS